MTSNNLPPLLSALMIVNGSRTILPLRIEVGSVLISVISGQPPGSLCLCGQQSLIKINTETQSGQSAHRGFLQVSTPPRSQARDRTLASYCRDKSGASNRCGPSMRTLRICVCNDRTEALLVLGRRNERTNHRALSSLVADGRAIHLV